MALENLFETAPHANDLKDKSVRVVAQLNSRPTGYLVVGLHRRDFLDISAYRVHEICALTREDGGARYHDNGVIHTILRGNFSAKERTHRELCFPEQQTAGAILHHISDSRNCGYDFPYDLSALLISPEEKYVSVVVPDDQFVRDTRYRPVLVDYIRRTKEGVLVLPCPAVYYASSQEEAQEAMRLLKDAVFHL